MGRSGVHVAVLCVGWAIRRLMFVSGDHDKSLLFVSFSADCPPGTFGKGCSNKCNCVNGKCSAVTGFCSCHAGFQGASCNQGTEFH